MKPELRLLPVTPHLTLPADELAPESSQDDNSVSLTLHTPQLSVQLKFTSLHHFQQFLRDLQATAPSEL